MNRRTGEFIYYLIGLFMYFTGLFINLNTPQELPERKPVISEFREYSILGAQVSSVASLSYR